MESAERAEERISGGGTCGTDVLMRVLIMISTVWREGGSCREPPAGSATCKRAE